MTGSNSNRLSPKSLSVARCTGALISVSVRRLVAVPSPVCATVEAPSGPEERLPVVMSEITSACGSGGAGAAGGGGPAHSGPRTPDPRREPLLVDRGRRLVIGGGAA